MSENEPAFLIGLPENIGSRTLRDWFAGMALQGLLADDAAQSADGVAGTAYEIADAMIAERDNE